MTSPARRSPDGRSAARSRSELLLVIDQGKRIVVNRHMAVVMGTELPSDVQIEYVDTVYRELFRQAGGNPDGPALVRQAVGVAAALRREHRLGRAEDGS